MEVDDQTDQRHGVSHDPDTPVVGRAESFESFVRREGHRLLGLAYALSGNRTAAEDLTQDALLAAYRNWDEVSVLDSPGAWARKVLANRAVSLIRRRVAEAKGLAALATSRHRSELPELSTDAEWIWREVRRLPKRQTQVVALRYYDQLSLAEIAAVLGCSKETVNTHLRRARKTLTRRLDLPGDHS